MVNMKIGFLLVLLFTFLTVTPSLETAEVKVNEDPIVITWDYDWYLHQNSSTPGLLSPAIRFYLNESYISGYIDKEKTKVWGKVEYMKMFIKKLKELISKKSANTVRFELHPRKQNLEKYYSPLGPKSFDSPDVMGLIELAKQLQLTIIFDGTFDEEKHYNPLQAQNEWREKRRAELERGKEGD